MEVKPYYFDPFEETGIEVPKNKRAEALEVVASFLKEQMLLYIGEGESPVNRSDGGKWVKALSKDYAEKKSLESGVDFANLELSGGLLSTLEVEPVKGEIKVAVDFDEYGGVSEGHLTGRYGDSKKIKPRVFMPQDDQRFRPDILKGIKEILQEYEEE